MRRAPFTLSAALVAVAATGCGTDSTPAPSVSAASAKPGPGSGFIGVDPSIFQCDSVVDPGAMAAAVGGAVEPMQSMFSAPRGTPKPCDFAMIDPPEAEIRDGAPAPAQPMWSIRFDCREDHMSLTEQEMQRLVAEEGAERVSVGAWGIEHRDAVLLFVDDDAPCTVRVVGPGVSERAAIARAVAAELTPATAPMRPRAAP